MVDPLQQTFEREELEMLRSEVTEAYGATSTEFDVDETDDRVTEVD